MSVEPGIALNLKNLSAEDEARICPNERIRMLKLSLRSEVNIAVLTYWQNMRDQDGLARKSTLDPAELTPCLPHLILMDVQHDPMDFRYRLIGETARYHLQPDLKGKWFSQIPYKAAPSRIHSAFSKVVCSRLPRSTRVPYVGPHSSFTEIEDLILPLASDAGTIDFLLISLDCFGLTGDCKPVDRRS